MATALQTPNYSAMKRIMKPRNVLSCSHLRVSKGSCLNCGKKLRNHQVRALPYFIKPPKNISFNVEYDSGLCSVEKKLCLVLDLDHTLLNSTPLDDLSSEEDYLSSIGDLSRRGLFRVESIGVWTKLRPFVRTFLNEASKLFDLYIYTMGDRKYAEEMAKLLDPENVYFNHSRIISRDDCDVKDRKGLDILQKPENSVLVLDDMENVWLNNKDNLILMDRYMYFSSSCRQFGVKCKSLSEVKRDEDELDGALSTVLQVLRKVHRNFKDNTNDIRDVREILKSLRKTILKGCKVVFSGVFPRNVEAEKQRLWQMADELGATCCVEVEGDVTHVVTIDVGTEKSKWAAQEGKFLVHPRWVEATYYLWRRQLEIKFEIAKKPNNKNHLFSLFEEKLNDDNYYDWIQNLRTFLKMERKEYVLEKPLPDVPNESASKDVHDAFNKHKDDSLEVTSLMLITMNYKFQKLFENVEAYDMIKQLKCLFEKHTRVVECTNAKLISKTSIVHKDKCLKENNKHVDGVKHIPKHKTKPYEYNY